MKHIAFLIILFVSILCNAAFAQQEKPKPAFHSIEQLAMVNGNNAVSGAVQTINGLGYNSWFAGIGIGLDFYRYRSAPVFLDLRKSFMLKQKNKLFVYVDGGYNIPWVKQKEDNPVWIWGWPQGNVQHEYKGGAYMDAGFGYAVQCKGGNALLLSTGYSHKYFSEKRTTTVNNESTETADVQRFTYSMNRLMIKLGWQF